MSATSCLLTEDQFLCSICLNVFTDPVTIPCGHNFCKTCITKHWDTDLPCQCPTCRKDFNRKPELQVNTLISEMSAQFRRSAQQEAKEVPRDVSSGSKLNTWMFFLACLCVFMAWMVSEQKTQAETLQVIQNSMELSKEDTNRQILTLKESVERSQAELIETMKEKQRTTEKLLHESDLKRVQQYEVNLTLDPDTAHPNLILPADGKQVKLGDVRKNLPDTSNRFDSSYSVLAKQSFSSGRFYYEVQVKGKTVWYLGVARESIYRKGKITLSPQNGYWTISPMNGDSYYARADPPVSLSLKSWPQKVGVFVDYEVGLVSFYDVDAAALICSFPGCSFTEKLYPYFSPGLNYVGKNSAPLIISPVSY